MNLERRADKLIREFVFERDGYRCVVGKGGCWMPLDPAHIRRRGFAATRWDPANILTLCRRHHSWFTDHPAEWDAFVISYIGEEAFENLRRKSLRNDVKARQLVESVIESFEQRELMEEMFPADSGRPVETPMRYYRETP